MRYKMKTRSRGRDRGVRLRVGFCVGLMRRRGWEGMGCGGGGNSLGGEEEGCEG